MRFADWNRAIPKTPLRGLHFFFGDPRLFGSLTRGELPHEVLSLGEARLSGGDVKADGSEPITLPNSGLDFLDLLGL
jgi:hypothetical protein